MFNLEPLILQIQEFNTNQLRTHQLLTVQNQLLSEIKEINSQIKELLKK